jgi:hypothetical protein
LTEPAYPALAPLFGFHPFEAAGTCARVHPHGPMPRHTDHVCMYCHRASPENEARIREAARAAELAEWRARAAYAADFARRVRDQRLASLRKSDRRGA